MTQPLISLRPSALLLTLLAFSAQPFLGCDAEDPLPSAETQDATPPPSGGQEAGVMSQDMGPADQGPQDMSPLDQDPQDAGPIEDMAWRFDLDVPPSHYSAQPEPTARLKAGFGERSLGFPMGAAVVGFGSRQGVVTPFAESYPGTDTQHTALTARALILRQGERAFVLVRTDMIGVWQGFVVDVQQQLNELGRGDLADGLVISATHTHASGGRVFNHPLGRIAVGPFKEEYYTRYRRAVLEAILDADAQMFDAKVGYDTISVASLHNDRRCENGPQQDDSMGLLKVTDDEGALKAVIINYAMHGTIVNNDQFMLSSDAPGAIERGIEQRLASYAPVMYLQSWAGDMSPRAPAEHIGPEGTDAREDLKELDAIGFEAATQVLPALEQIETSSTLELRVKTIRVPATNERINPDGAFDRFPYGGTFCMPAEANCDEPQQRYTPETLSCVPVPEPFGVSWVQLASAWLGEPAQLIEGGGLTLVTLPGEPLTSVGVELRDRAREATSADQAWVLGYAQGYLAYLLHPDDFYLGGYEAQGALWGPGFGQFLIDRGVEIAAHLKDGGRPLSFIPLPLPAPEPFEEKELSYERPLSAPSWLSEVRLDEQGLWVASWAGGDPAVDQPVVTLERSVEEGEALTWEPVRHLSGLAWSSDGMELQLSLSVDPPYTESLFLEERTFQWKVMFPNTFSVTPSAGQLNGQFRVKVTGKLPDPYSLTSEPFTITR